MKNFSKKEKNIVRRMIEIDNKVGSLNVLNNILFSSNVISHISGKYYIEIKSEHDIHINVRDDAIANTSVDFLREIDDEVTKSLISVVTLFQYLEEEKLAYFIGEVQSSSIGEVWADVNYTKCEFLDDEIKPLVYRYSRKKIFVSETLRSLEKNDFKTDEEIRHLAEIATMKRQLNLTHVALGFTFFGLLASILVPIFVTSSVEVKNSNVSQVLNEVNNELKRLSVIEVTLSKRLSNIESSIVNLKNKIDIEDARISQD